MQNLKEMISHRTASESINKLLAAVLLLLIFSGCGTATQRVYEHSKYSRGSHQHAEALFRDQQNCSNLAFKQGIRIAGVRYYDYESAREAYKNYQQKYQLGVVNAPKAPHQEQYDYMNSRRKECMKSKGWYRVTI